MKKILLIAAGLSLGVATTSCSLEKFPETMYAENNTSGTGDSETAINTRELLEGQLTAMYNYMKGDLQTYWYQLITLAESRADNAYGAANEAKTMAVEQNQIDSDSEFASNLWNYSMNAVDYANQVICNIDLVKENDPSLTDKEYQEWLSEALCWRAYVWMNMMQLFGEIPMLTEIPPAINAGNVEEVYPLYFPSRVSKQTVGEQIVKDIEEYACKYAPDMDASNKFRITKGFAYGLMARFYSMREFRDWSKVVSACEAVEGMGYSLCDKYGDLWAYTTGDTGMAAMNTRESIFEVQWTSQTSGSWMWMMFHRNAYVPGDSFSWAKWCTPSRNLTKAYDAEGDTERKNASVVYDECGWSYHYPGVPDASGRDPAPACRSAGQYGRSGRRRRHRGRDPRPRRHWQADCGAARVGRPDARSRAPRTPSGTGHGGLPLVRPDALRRRLFETVRNLRRRQHQRLGVLRLLLPDPPRDERQPRADAGADFSAGG